MKRQRATAPAASAPAARARRWRWLALEMVLIVAALAATRVLSINLWLLPNGDVKEYYNYAIAFWTWHPYFHNLPVEYPPLAIVPFTLTLLPPVLDYQTTFALWMGALVILGYFGFLRFSTRARGLFYVFYLVLGAAATLLARFDILPALVTLAALWAAGRKRFGVAYALLAVGILLKLYPAFLVPIVVIEHWRIARTRTVAEGLPLPLANLREWREAPGASLRRLLTHAVTRRVALGVGLCAALVTLAFACALMFNPNGALSGFQYAGARPLQIESTPATILWLGSLVGIKAGPNYSFTSLNFVGPLDVALKPLSAVALAGGCLWVYWRQARGKLSVGRAFLACLCVVLVTNKIFSPQYLIWVLPIVAETEGFDVVWVAICFLTTLDFPILYQLRHPIWTVSYTPLFMPVLALRNGLLLWVTVRAILRCTQGTARSGALKGQGAAGMPAARQDEREDSQPALAR
ncbi:MAG TPA: glycosyltransferase family 87 protein [Ktedonobacterales bacterium]|nr:glycosyltransferase family 87 protein [Ktedonobacterales bacterium]